MNKQELAKEIENKVANGRKSMWIVSDDKDGHKYEVHLIAMSELSEGEINGTAAVSIDGKHYRDMTLKQVLPIFDHMVSVNLK